MIEEAISARKDGMLQRAVELLEEYCNEWPSDAGALVTLSAWKKELTESCWCMSRRDKESSSANMGFGRWSKVSEIWSHRFSSEIASEILPDVPSPVVVSDLIIVPNPSMEGFLVLNVSDGKKVGSVSIPGAKLSSSSTPVSVDSSIFFATDGSIWQTTLSSANISADPVLSDSRIKPVSHSAPSVDSGIAIFVFYEWILLYEYKNRVEHFLPFSLSKSDDLLAKPVIGEEVVFVSRCGEILLLERDRLVKLEEPKDGICSPPCLVDGSVYFERLNGTERAICSFDIRERRSVTKVIEEGFCSPEDKHLNFSPIAFNRGVLISSDVEPRFYYAERRGDEMSISSFDLNISAGYITLHQTSHILSSILGERLVGKVRRGFFHINLFSLEDGRIELFRPQTEMVAQPVSYGERLIFLVKDGVRCYAVR
jgi:hypothetical protein